MDIAPDIESNFNTHSDRSLHRLSQFEVTNSSFGSFLIPFGQLFDLPTLRAWICEFQACVISEIEAVKICGQNLTMSQPITEISEATIFSNKLFKALDRHSFHDPVKGMVHFNSPSDWH